MTSVHTTSLSVVVPANQQLQELKPLPMFIYDKMIYRWLKLSLVLNIALCLITAKFCQSRPLQMFHSFAFRISGYLIVLAICAEFSEELEELECAR